VQQKIDALAAKSRGVFICEPGLGGTGIVAATAVRQSVQYDLDVTVLCAAARAPRWRLHMAHAWNPDGVVVLSPQRLNNHPASFSPDRLLVVDQACLSYDLESTSWSHFAPAVRRASHVLMLVRFDKWPKAIKHVELVSHMDEAVTFHESEISGAPDRP
jgi:hypothetical protein